MSRSALVVLFLGFWGGRGKDGPMTPPKQKQVKFLGIVWMFFSSLGRDILLVNEKYMIYVDYIIEYSYSIY